MKHASVNQRLWSVFSPAELNQVFTQSDAQAKEK